MQMEVALVEPLEITNIIDPIAQYGTRYTKIICQIAWIWRVGLDMSLVEERSYSLSPLVQVGLYKAIIESHLEINLQSH